MITDGARYAPRRTLLPPGTIRTLSSKAKRRSGRVSLSKNEYFPSLQSFSFPRNPSRIASLYPSVNLPASIQLFGHPASCQPPAGGRP